MKKKILLIGNTNGLPGVKIDLENYKNYFKSNTGGQWYDSEIIEELDVKKDKLSSILVDLKSQELDYLIIIFSGHGGVVRDTVLELNNQYEYFSESHFNNISKRQVTILDCCRSFAPNLSESIRAMNFSKSLSTGTRQRFEKRISESSDIQIKMYSCAVGECSHDTPKGGAYSKNLIEYAYADGSEFIYFGPTHVLAAQKTTVQFKDQNPEIIIPRMLTSQQVILGIN